MTHPVSDATGILIEAEDFDEFGGWVLDSQFETIMGSPYLMAHGLGRPVADATTTISVPEAGFYHLWVRSKDWVPHHHPGRFLLAIDCRSVAKEFGASGQDWAWEYGGSLELPSGKVGLSLIDLTGFNGRCDAIYFGRDRTPTPDGATPAARVAQAFARSSAGAP